MFVSPFELFRMRVYTILKCGYGWNGCYEKGFCVDDWEDFIKNAFLSGMEDLEVAQAYADELNKFDSECWRPRIDGRPNAYKVNGVL